MSQTAVSFEQVTRTFGAKTAVDALDLHVEPGTVLGLIGRNGAGKTTCLRLALGLLYADSGRVRVLGLDPATTPIEVRTRVSLLSEESDLYPWMTVREILDFASALHPRWDRELAASLTRRLDLDPSPRIRNLSRGNRAKVALVLAVACRPEVLLLDDPTAGLDPLVRREVLESVLAAVPEQGGAVVYASHLIQDIERVADHVAVMDGGSLQLEGSLEQLKARVRRVTAVFENAPPDAVDIPGTIDCSADGRVLALVAEGDDAVLTAGVRELGARTVEIEPLSLEEILVACLRGGGTREAEHV